MICKDCQNSTSGYCIKHFPNNAQQDDSGFLGQIIGEASMCWEPLPSGVFDSEKAKALVEKLEKYVSQVIQEAYERGKSDGWSEGFRDGQDPYYGLTGDEVNQVEGRDIG